MIIFILIGSLFTFLSIGAAPFAILFPSKFLNYFTLASTNFIVALAFYYGPKAYFNKLVTEKENIPITGAYFGSLLVSLICQFTGKNGYLITVLLIIIQGLALFFFIMQAYMGGNEAQKNFKSFADSATKKGMQAVVAH